MLSQLANSFLVLADWLYLFRDILQKALARPMFDHCPISLVSGLEDWSPPFWLEMMLLKEDAFISNVVWWHEWSRSGWMGFQLSQKFKFLKKKLNNSKLEVF